MNCPVCQSDFVEVIDEDYAECCDCGHSWSPSDGEEVEYTCPKCGGAPDEHPEVLTPDGNNVMQVCPPK